MIKERRIKILEILEQKGEVSLQELHKIFPEVSQITLRRDLILIENEGLLIRTYKGAVSSKKINSTSDEDPYTRRVSENREAKMEIARKALPFVEKGRSVYFDNGTTIMCLAEILPDDNYTIITSGVNVTLELMKRDKLSAMILGGWVNKNTVSVAGHTAITSLTHVNIDIAFMSASGFSLENGFTNSNVYEYEIKKKIVETAKKIFILMDSTKINKNLPFTFARLENIDSWICEKKLPPEMETEIKKFNVELI
jgi:DeoR/GlpR family transcriptional regulator of sugar metabolism